MSFSSFINGNSKGRQILLHVAFWLFILMYFSWGFGHGKSFTASMFNIIVYLPGFMLLVYALMYFLIPRYLVKKRYTPFLGLLLLFLLICTVYAEVAQAWAAGEVFNGVSLREGRGVLPFVHVAGIAISINMLLYWFRQKQETLEMEQRRTAAELELLKAQVHPHFLFNTLNNLYSLMLDNAPAAPEIVLKLSGLLRFMIYESNAPVIPLSKEIMLLTEYIALEEIRYGDRLDISMIVKGDPEGKQVPPLLMLPLVENAFKHGTSRQTDQCWISFYLNITPGGLHFKLVNSKDDEQTISGQNAKGVGLKNVQRRLGLLYPGKHHFVTEEDKDVFIVNLNIYTSGPAPAQQRKPGYYPPVIPVTV